MGTFPEATWLESQVPQVMATPWEILEWPAPCRVAGILTERLSGVSRDPGSLSDLSLMTVIFWLSARNACTACPRKRGGGGSHCHKGSSWASARPLDGRDLHWEMRGPEGGHGWH